MPSPLSLMGAERIDVVLVGWAGDVVSAKVTEL
jgi:hypothetical protein